jgi:hypothetical protein
MFSRTAANVMNSSSGQPTRNEPRSSAESYQLTVRKPIVVQDFGRGLRDLARNPEKSGPFGKSRYTDMDL